MNSKAQLQIPATMKAMVLGFLLSPAAGAGLMTVSTVAVAINAGLLKIKE